MGFPNIKETKKRENIIVSWLNSIEEQASHIFLLGDIFDFWIEYKHFIPKTTVKFLAKLQELSDKGIKIYMFSGNHDNWWKNYFVDYIGVHKMTTSALYIKINKVKLFLHHGHYVGHKGIFASPLKIFFYKPFYSFIQFIFHPDFVASSCFKIFTSNQSKRIEKDLKNISINQNFLSKIARLLYKKYSPNYIFFGHKHIAEREKIAEDCEYVNLGEWMISPHYAIFDGNKVELKKYL